MSEMTPEIKQQMSEAVQHLRDQAEKFGAKSTEFETAFAKTETDMKKFDDANQKMVADIMEERKQREELKGQLDDLEKEVVRAQSSGNGKKEIRHTQEYKAFESFMKGSSASSNITTMFVGKGNDAPAEFKQNLLRLDDPTSGGYLSMPEMDDMIIRQITEISPVRMAARVKTVGRKTLTIPVRTSIPIARYEGEAEAAQDSTSTYGSETITCYRQSVTVPYTMDILMDSGYDLMSEINQDVSEAYAFGEGNRFVLGSGSREPEGFVSNSILSAAESVSNPSGYRTSSASGTFSFDDLINLTGDLKVGYMPMFAFSRRTKAFIATLKGSDGQYLWKPAQSGAPAMINGDPYMLFEDMPDIAADAFSVVYADFMRGYCITERSGLEVIRDPYSKKAQNIIEVTYHKYNTGQVILPEAFKLLRCAS